MSDIRNPFSLVPIFSNLERELNQMFSSNFEPSAVTASDWQPRVDIIEEDSQFLIKVDVPGTDPKDIDVSLDNNMLIIKGEKEAEHRERKDNFIRHERSKGSFCRRITLPDVVDGEKVSAKGKNGVLEITIPKSPKTVVRRISVEE